MSHCILKSGLGYIVGSGVAQAAGDWRWGVRTTPFLAYIALAVLVLFLTDPPRGIQFHQHITVMFLEEIILQ